MKTNKNTCKKVISCLLTALITFTCFSIFPNYKVYSLELNELNNEILDFVENTSIEKEDFVSEVTQIYIAETMLRADINEVKEIAKAQKKTISNLNSKENPVVNPYAVTTKSNSLNAAYSTTDMGTMYFNGSSVHLYYSMSPSVIDAANSAAVLTDLCGSDPIGVPGGCSIIGDHNTQTGYLMGRTKVGDKICIKTPYGQFIYRVTNTCLGYENHGSFVYNNKLYYDDLVTNDGTSIIATANYKQFNGIIFYTCYPFNAKATDQRFFVFAQLVEGTQLT